MFIYLDLSVVEHIAHDVIVMYLGRVVEHTTKEELFANPRHPYTQALLSSTPQLNPEHRRERIKLVGELPSPLDPPKGCAFHTRCQFANERCNVEQPILTQYGKSLIACHAVEEQRI